MPQFHFDNLDAAENVFFERQLEQVKAGSYDVKYPNLVARLLIPVDGTVPTGAETVVYRQYDQVGLAKIIGTYARDLPRADVKGKEFRAAIKSLGAAYGYTVQEIRAATQGGVPLDARRAAAARRAIEEKIDVIVFAGDSVHALGGFHNNANIPEFTLPSDGTGATKTWSTKTPDQILRDMNKLAQKVIDGTYGVEQPDTMLMPLSQYGYIAATPRSSTSDTTILEFFLRANPYIRNVQGWYRLAGAGAGATDRLFCYRRDPNAVGLVIPQEFEQFPPQPEGLEFEVPCHARCGGVIWYYPMSAAFADGC